MQPPPPTAIGSAPFGLQISSEDAVPLENWRQASSEAMAALRRGEPVALLGLPGTGKTSLLRSLGRTLQSEGLPVRHLDTSEAQGPELQNDIILVDDADRQPEEALDALRGRGGLFILAGQPEFARYLAHRACSVVTVKLEPLSPEDVARFVASRLSATGHRRNLLEPDAVLALFRHSGGLLRLVVMLARSAMFLAQQEGAERVSKRHVDEAAAVPETRNDVQASEPDLVRPSRRTGDPTVFQTLAGPGPRMLASRSWGKQAALGVCGLMLVTALGWLLLPGRSSMPVPASPQHDAAVTAPSASVPVPWTIRAPEVAQSHATSPGSALVSPPAPVGLPGDETSSSANVPDRIASPVPSRPNSLVEAFQGPILNETLNQKGQLSLEIRRTGATDVTVHFRATAGLIGSGELTGTMAANGRIMAAGRLMMGRNPFDSTLVATLVGDRLEGTATFTRPETGSIARSRFGLSRF